MKGSLQVSKGYYYVVTYQNGKPKWYSTHIKVKRGNKKIAQERMISILAELDVVPNRFDKIDFCDYANRWLKEVENKIDVRTFEEHKRTLQKHILPYFKPLKLSVQDIKVSHIDKYYKHKMTSGRLDGKSGGLSRTSVKRHGVVLSLIFRQAKADELITNNPCEAATIPKEKQKLKRTSSDFYTVEQCKGLLQITEGTTLHDMIYVTFMYGLRRSELMGLRWKDVSFSDETITIQHTVVAGDTVTHKDRTKNKTSNRVYPLLPDIKDMLLERQAEQKRNRDLLGNGYVDTPYIFVKADGSEYYPTYPTQMLTKTLKKNGLPHIRWHDLRHSCASMLIDKGWAMKDISDWLGHSEIGITMNIYGHLSMEHKRKAADSLNGLLD